MISEAQLAYYAGLFDGEGCVYIKPGLKQVGRIHSLVVSVSITMTDTVALCALERDFGGKLRRSVCRDLARHKKIPYRWQLSSRMAETFLRAIRPFVMVKAAQVDVALQFRDRINLIGHWAHQGLPPGEFEFRLELSHRMSELKKIPAHGTSGGILANSGNPAMGTAELNGVDVLTPKSVETKRQTESQFRLFEDIVQANTN